jgi:tRNA(Ile)-lysidine synthase
MHTSQHEFERRFAEAWPVADWRDLHVVLAVSGGADSVAMLRAASALKESAGGRGRLHVAHLNHGLRGAEGDRDEAWVAALCERFHVRLETGKADVAALASDQGDGFEAAARAARYDFLLRVAEKLGARFVATAHTADDQAETVLHRILRGTGLAGLRGIPDTRRLSTSVVLVRPARKISRREVIEYLAALGQDYRTDSSNAETHWTRNRLRNELLPMLRERFNASVDEALINLAAQASEAQEFIAREASDLAHNCLLVEFSSTVGDDAGEKSDRKSAVRARIDCLQIEYRLPIVIREI